MRSISRCKVLKQDSVVGIMIGDLACQIRVAARLLKKAREKSNTSIFNLSQHLSLFEYRYN